MAANKKTRKASNAKKAKAEKLSVGKTPARKSEKTAEVPVDRRAARERRNGEERRKQEAPVAVERRALQRRAKVNRRRQIDPTTCERDYLPEEIEFMGALDEYKRHSGRMFPTCSEVLEVLKKLGYEKRPKDEPAELMPAPLGNMTPQVTADYASV